MLSPSVRRYNGRLAKTTTVSVNYRIHNVVQEIVEVAKPEGSKKHQCSGGYVWSFTPDPSFQCCKRRGCMAHFTSNLDTRIIEARAPFFDGSLTPKERQARLMANRTELKVPGQDGNMVQVCTAAVCKTFGVSRSFWYPLNQYKPTRAEANMSRAKKNVAITAWLRTAKETMDVMPDDGFFLCNFPRKKDLYDQFMLDVERDVANVTHPCHKSYFLQTMRELFP